MRDMLVETAPDQDDVQFLEDEINAYNVAVTGIDDWQALAIFVRDAAGAIMAGVDGGSWGGYLEIKHLWVRHDLRGQGYGSRLLGMAEQEAARRGCSQVLLDTHDFQAYGFYLARGYQVLGALHGIGGRHSRYYMRKGLATPQH
jgi:GNAT superfamily N-acetyltransferase